jgi:hypothetical protein
MKVRQAGRCSDERSAGIPGDSNTCLSVQKRDRVVSDAPLFDVPVCGWLFSGFKALLITKR